MQAARCRAGRARDFHSRLWEGSHANLGLHISREIAREPLVAYNRWAIATAVFAHRSGVRGPSRKPDALFMPEWRRCRNQGIFYRTSVLDRFWKCRLLQTAQVFLGGVSVAPECGSLAFRHGGSPGELVGGVGICTDTAEAEVLQTFGLTRAQPAHKGTGFSPVSG